MATTLSQVGTVERTLPSFERDEFALLISAVEKALERLLRANQRVGGNDSELIEYGRRYSIIRQQGSTADVGSGSPQSTAPLPSVSQICIKEDIRFLLGRRGTVFS